MGWVLYSLQFGCQVKTGVKEVIWRSMRSLTLEIWLIWREHDKLGRRQNGLEYNRHAAGCG